jgi:hypothetical protein
MRWRAHCLEHAQFLLEESQAQEFGMKFRTEYEGNNESTDGNPILSHRMEFREHNAPTDSPRFDHANSDPADGDSDRRPERDDCLR